MISRAPSIFNDLVAESIASHGLIPLDQIVVLDNSAKYCPDAIKTKNHDQDSNLAAIFDTMAVVNRQALEDDSLCTGVNGRAFNRTLRDTVDQLVEMAQGRPVRYVELGPEPWKSSFILSRMIDAKVDLQQYIGIDINPASEAPMRDRLVPIIGENRFSYWISDFHACGYNEYPKPKKLGLDDDNGPPLTIVMNLGFQEGNDLPSKLGPMLTQITRPGDLILSEMQVLADRHGPETIQAFYFHPQMHRFSALVGQNFDKTVCTELEAVIKSSEGYTFYLVPVRTEIGPVMVAATLFSVVLEGQKLQILTNSCIKYTLEQFKVVREECGEFIVREMLATGDKSVVFQIAQRI